MRIATGCKFKGAVLCFAAKGQPLAKKKNNLIVWEDNP